VRPFTCAAAIPTRGELEDEQWGRAMRDRTMIVSVATMMVAMGVLAVVAFGVDSEERFQAMNSAIATY